jgi:hypothetical protein
MTIDRFEGRLNDQQEDDELNVGCLDQRLFNTTRIAPFNVFCVGGDKVKQDDLVPNSKVDSNSMFGRSKMRLGYRLEIEQLSDNKNTLAPFSLSRSRNTRLFIRLIWRRVTHFRL